MSGRVWFRRNRNFRCEMAQPDTLEQKALCEWLFAVLERYNDITEESFTALDRHLLKYFGEHCVDIIFYMKGNNCGITCEVQVKHFIDFCISTSCRILAILPSQQRQKWTKVYSP